MFPPSQTQDANQALEDAWLLRGTLRAQWDLPAALRRYGSTSGTGTARFPTGHQRGHEQAGTPVRPPRRVPSARIDGRAAYGSVIRRFSGVLQDEH